MLGAEIRHAAKTYSCASPAARPPSPQPQPFDVTQQASDTDVTKLVWAAPDILAENVLAVAKKVRGSRPDMELVVSEYGEFVDPDTNGISPRVSSTKGRCSTV